MRHKRPSQRMFVERLLSMTISPQSGTRAVFCARCGTVNSYSRLVPPAFSSRARHCGTRAHGTQEVGRRSAAKCWTGALPNLGGDS